MSRKHPPATLAHILDACCDGNRAKLALRLGITRSAVSQWSKVPTAQVFEVEKLSGISRYQIRPDVYGDRPVDAEPAKLPKGGKAA